MLMKHSYTFRFLPTTLVQWMTSSNALLISDTWMAINITEILLVFVFEKRDTIFELLSVKACEHAEKSPRSTCLVSLGLPSCYLRTICIVWCSLSQSDSGKLVHVFIWKILDNCCATFTGLSKHMLNNSYSLFRIMQQVYWHNPQGLNTLLLF